MHIVAPPCVGRSIYGGKWLFMADKLLDCANKYKDLMGWDYEFIIGRKGVTRSFTVDFCEDDFHHLTGLHKLRDNDYVRTTKRSKIFDAILSGKLTEKKISSSQYYNLVDERMNAFLKIADVLEQDPQLFRYSIKRADAFSRIDADYLIYHYGDRNIYLFLKKRISSDNYACISLFFEDRTDYTKGQARYTLLRLMKTNKITGAKEMVFCNPNYKTAEGPKELKEHMPE